jgi:HAE1 family hydrophobic/amphiphilic exporter-1
VAAAGGSIPASIKRGRVAVVRRSASPETINDTAQQPQVTVNAYPAPGVSSSTAQASITTVMAAVKLPPGYSYTIGGAAQNQSEIFLPLVLSIGLSPILIYMLLAALYESLVLPFAVLLAQPLAVLGALVTLLLGGSTINLFSMIGLVLLIGLVSKNGILLIDRTEKKRREGLSAVEALAEAGRVRLRPILMTSMTLVVAMLPIALSTSSGSEYRAPLALVLIGGMSSSTVLALLIVPSLYTLLDSVRGRLPRGLRGLLRGRVPRRLVGWLRGEPVDGGRNLAAPAATKVATREPGTEPEGLLMRAGPTPEGTQW